MVALQVLRPQAQVLTVLQLIYSLSESLLVPQQQLIGKKKSEHEKPRVSDQSLPFNQRV